MTRKKEKIKRERQKTKHKELTIPKEYNRTNKESNNKQQKVKT